MAIPANTASIDSIRSTIKSLETNKQNTQSTSPIRDGGNGLSGPSFGGSKKGGKVKRSSM